jgi:geranylgeranyl diphosphate synthase type II
MSNSAFHSHIAGLRAVIEAALAHELGRVQWPESLATAVEYSLMAGGKRLRPILVLLGNEICGGSQQDAIPAACSIEMIHTYSLVHDDLPSMDDDDFRRGRPTCHRVFGEALAILAGDCLLTQAFVTLAASGLDTGRIAKLTQVLAAAAGGSGMVGGQVLDLEAERGEFLKSAPACDMLVSGTVRTVERVSMAESASLPTTDFPKNGFNHTASGDVDSLKRIHRMKTGALIASALELGAVSASAGSPQREALRQYGHCIGLAFQITDDLLDVTGDPARIGKTPGRDVHLGKLTYPGLLGIEQSRVHANDLVVRACQSLECFGEKAVWLNQLARYIVERDH